MNRFVLVIASFTLLSGASLAHASDAQPAVLSVPSVLPEVEAKLREIEQKQRAVASELDTVVVSDSAEQERLQRYLAAY